MLKYVIAKDIQSLSSGLVKPIYCLLGAVILLAALGLTESLLGNAGHLYLVYIVPFGLFTVAGIGLLYGFKQHEQVWKPSGGAESRFYELTLPITPYQLYRAKFMVLVAAMLVRICLLILSGAGFMLVFYYGLEVFGASTKSEPMPGFYTSAWQHITQFFAEELPFVASFEGILVSSGLVLLVAIATSSYSAQDKELQKRVKRLSYSSSRVLNGLIDLGTVAAFIYILSPFGLPYLGCILIGAFFARYIYADCLAYCHNEFKLRYSPKVLVFLITAGVGVLLYALVILFGGAQSPAKTNLKAYAIGSLGAGYYVSEFIEHLTRPSVNFDDIENSFGLFNTLVDDTAWSTQKKRLEELYMDSTQSCQIRFTALNWLWIANNKSALDKAILVSEDDLPRLASQFHQCQSDYRDYAQFIASQLSDRDLQRLYGKYESSESWLLNWMAVLWAEMYPQLMRKGYHKALNNSVAVSQHACEFSEPKAFLDSLNRALQRQTLSLAGWTLSTISIDAKGTECENWIANFKYHWSKRIAELPKTFEKHLMGMATSSSLDIFPTSQHALAQQLGIIKQQPSPVRCHYMQQWVSLAKMPHNALTDYPVDWLYAENSHWWSMPELSWSDCEGSAK